MLHLPHQNNSSYLQILQSVSFHLLWSHTAVCVWGAQAENDKKKREETDVSSVHTRFVFPDGHCVRSGDPAETTELGFLTDGSLKSLDAEKRKSPLDVLQVTGHLNTESRMHRSVSGAQTPAAHLFSFVCIEWDLVNMWDVFSPLWRQTAVSLF